MTSDATTRASDASVRAELGRIFTVGFRDGELNPADRAYVVQVVAARTGMSQADAEKRVNDVLAQAKAAADEARAAADAARKAAAYFSLWIFISLLIGAFCASYAATIGGRQRDRVTV
jgi:membrane protein involved in colicin uptake